MAPGDMQEENGSMDLAGEALKMAGALATVIALLLGGVFVLRRVMGEMPGMGMSRLRTLGHLRLGPGKAIVLVELAGEVLVLGSTNRDLTLLARVTDQTRVEQLRTLGFPAGKQWLFWRGMNSSSSGRDDGDSRRMPQPAIEE